MYTLDTQSARKADSAGAFIAQIGKYVGKFTNAVDIEASTGTRGIGFKFESNRQKANLSIYTRRANGEPIMGMDVLNAIMTCLQLRTIQPQNGNYMKWDKEQKKEVTTTGRIFPELQNKPIGLLLETEDYYDHNGELRQRMVIAGVFQAETELTASEILDRKTVPEQLAKRVALLRHRPVKASTAATSQPVAPAKSGEGFADMEDDAIPF